MIKGVFLKMLEKIRSIQPAYWAHPNVGEASLLGDNNAMMEEFFSCRPIAWLWRLIKPMS